MKVLLSVGLVLSVAVQGIASVAYGEELWHNPGDFKRDINLKLPNFVPVVEALSDSVVNISSEGLVDSNFNSPLLDPFFGRMQPLPNKKQKLSNLGSGFVINKDGLIVTNFHVIDGASKIKVSFKDSDKTYRAEVIGSDERTDLALLKVKDAPDNLRPVVFGDSDSVRPGEWVIAIGNPFGLGNTATVGIVSATARSVGASNNLFIQTDASINPGNSGGPLFDASGTVIGVNNSIFTRQGGNIGIGFAIPINKVKEIIPELNEFGVVTRGWLGVLIQDVTDELASAFKLSSAKGALVSQVVDGSPADLAGFKQGDVIVSYDGKTVESHDDLPGMVAKTKVDTTVDIVVIRKGKKTTLKTTIGKLEATGQAVPAKDDIEQELGRFGFSVQDLTPEMSRALNLQSGGGVVVSDVKPLSPADDAGMKRSDVILEVNQVTIQSKNELVVELSKAGKDQAVLMLVQRGGNTIFMTLVGSE